MEISTSVKDVVDSTSQFIAQQSEMNLTKLQRNLDAINGLISRDSSGLVFKVIDPRGMLGVECLSNLSSILTSSIRIRPTLSGRILQFLELLVRDDSIRVALRSSFNFLAAFSTFLQNHDHDPKDEVTSTCISLLQKITFGFETENESHQHLEFLVSLLISALLTGEQPPMTLTSLALLANLSKNNHFVQSLIKNHVNIKPFYKRLIACLNHKEDTAVVICAKSVFSNLYLNSHGCNDRLGEKFFSQANIRQTFQLILNCMQKATEASSLFAQCYGVDLLLTLLQVPSFANCFLTYDHRDTFVNGLVDLLIHLHVRRKALKDDASFILYKFLELFSLLSSFEDLHKTFSTVMTPNTPGSVPGFMACLVSISEMGPKLLTKSSLDTSAAALDVLDCMLRLCHTSSASSIYVNTVIPVASTLLGLLIEQPPFNQSPTNSRDSTIVGSISFAAPVTQSSSMVVGLLHVVATIYRLLTFLLKFPNAVATFKQGNSFSCPVTMIESIRNQICFSVLDRSSSIPMVWHQAGLDVVLQALHLLVIANKMKGVDQEVQSRLTSFLEDSQNISLVARGMVSTNKNRVAVSLSLLKELMESSSFNPDQFSTTLTTLNTCSEAEKKSAHDGESSAKRHASMVSVSNPVFGVSNKENVFNMGQQFLKDDSGDKVDKVLSRLAEESGEAKDLRTSEIMAVYEHKFKSLSMKENHLQDLLDAKALALSQADRLIAQYRCRKAESEAEMTRLRTMLQDSEKESEKSRDLLNTARLEVERLQHAGETLRRENSSLQTTAEAFKTLTVERAETVKKLEDATRNNQKLRQENKTLMEMNDMQKKHNESLRATNDNQAEQIAVLDEDSKRVKEELSAITTELTTTRQKAQKATEDGDALEKEKAKLEESIDSYRKKLDVLEKTCKEQKHQLSSLKVVVEKHEAAIAEKDRRNKELEEKLDQHSAMISMIQNITTGKKK